LISPCCELVDSALSLAEMIRRIHVCAKMFGTRDITYRSFKLHIKKRQACMILFSDAGSILTIR
jgi:hypothetical protein